MSAHHDSIQLDAQLYWRIKTLHDQLDDLELDPEQRYLVERHYTEKTQAGAGLEDDAKARLTEINQRLSTLTTTFEKNLLADTNDLAVVFDSADELDGLSEGELSATAQAAADRGLDGSYLVTLTLFTGHPYLASLTNRDEPQADPGCVALARIAGQRVRQPRGAPRDRASARRAGGAPRLPLARRVRHRRRDRRISRSGAQRCSASSRPRPRAMPAASRPRSRRSSTPSRSPSRSRRTTGRSTPRRCARPSTTSTGRPCVRGSKPSASSRTASSAPRPSCTASRSPSAPDLTAYHPDARVFEVHNPDGSALGLFILDLYTRDTKRGGAWMNSIVSQSRLRGTSPVVVNNLNVSKPAPGKPTLLSLDEVTTLFHEFGHALHGLFATVTYPHFAGTNVFRDFVEFPSQVNEMWIYWPEVLATYARHVETGEPLPAEVIEKLDASETFNQGFATSEYLAASWLDQAWHSLTVDAAAATIDVAAFEASALADIGLDNPVVPTRYSSTYFAHVFSGGYSAGYYSYIWSEVLDADTVEWFRENGGLTRDNGERFRQRLLGVGGSKDPLEAYRDFRGRDAEIGPLLKRGAGDSRR